MKNKFVFATGNLWRFSDKTGANLIDLAKRLDIDGVEITFSSKDQLYSFKLNPSQIMWLRKLQYVSIHSPFNLVEDVAGDKQEILDQMVCLHDLAQKVKAKNVIIHPHSLPSIQILKKSQINKIKISIENLVKKRKFTITRLEQVISKYKNIGLCLDVSHAYLWSHRETEELVKKFHKIITQIHFSGTYKKKDHQSLRKVSPLFIKSIQPIKKLNVPIIIEEDMKTKDIKWIKSEIDYIKSLFI